MKNRVTTGTPPAGHRQSAGSTERAQREYWEVTETTERRLQPTDRVLGGHRDHCKPQTVYHDDTVSPQRVLGGHRQQIGVNFGCIYNGNR